MNTKRFMYSLATFLFLLTIPIAMLGNSACTEATPMTADTGITKATAEITTGIDGLTVEQRNVKKRLEVDNLAGSIKHIYIMSAYSGQTLIYSTVDGKVSSSGKRLTPTSVVGTDGQYVDRESLGIPVSIGGFTKYTNEVLQDDGTYGSSAPYLYWFDTQGNYHQHYVSGGQIVHVSDEPLAVTDVVIRIGSVDE